MYEWMTIYYFMRSIVLQVQKLLKLIEPKYTVYTSRCYSLSDCTLITQLYLRMTWEFTGISQELNSLMTIDSHVSHKTLSCF